LVIGLLLLFLCGDKSDILNRSTLPAFPAFGELPLYHFTARITVPGRQFFLRKRLIDNSFRFLIIVILNAQLGPAFYWGKVTDTSGEKFIFQPAADPFSIQDVLEDADE
jgi:hypothetical protein